MYSDVLNVDDNFYCTCVDCRHLHPKYQISVSDGMLLYLNSQ